MAVWSVETGFLARLMSGASETFERGVKLFTPKPYVPPKHALDSGSGVWNDFKSLMARNKPPRAAPGHLFNPFAPGEKLLPSALAAAKLQKARAATLMANAHLADVQALKVQGPPGTVWNAVRSAAHAEFREAELVRLAGDLDR